MWQCPNCNTNNHGNFCPKCGATQSRNKQRPLHNMQAQYVSGQKKHNGIVIAMCIVLTAIITAFLTFAVIYVLGDETNNTVQGEYEKKPVKTEENKPGTEEVPDEKPTKLQGKSQEAPAASEQKSEAPQFGMYQNDSYGFSCAYPLEFNQQKTNSINALKQYVSGDGNAVMTIRANTNHSNITIEQALNDFYNAFDGEVTYEASGNTWYAISITKDNGRSLYRKLFIKNGNVYCMDFEMNEQDVEKYSPYIEYIEDNFSVNN